MKKNKCRDKKKSTPKQNKWKDPQYAISRLTGDGKAVLKTVFTEIVKGRRTHENENPIGKLESYTGETLINSMIEIKRI